MDNPLATIANGTPLQFEADGKVFQFRQPRTEEYDDALALEGLVRRRVMAMPELQSLKEKPCSDMERMTIERLIEMATAELDEAEPGSLHATTLGERLGLYRRLLDNRTLADEIANERAILARDRWLTIHLLCDEHGRQLFDPDDVQSMAAWEKVPIRIKDAARPLVWEVLRLVVDAPFDWAMLPEPRLYSASASGRGPSVNQKR